ncbi:MAG: hypothetical protein ACRELZ_17170 [Candidatus Rokuibacteriota bacterium]
MDKLNLIALILNVVFFGVNVWLLVRHRRAGRALVTTSTREARIERVVREYMHLVTSHVDTGVHALIVAGVKGLHTSEEISDAIGRIADRAGTHPLVGEARRLAPGSLKEFFAAVTVRGPITLGEQEALAKIRSTAAPG